jgi:hypothetical protein
VTSATTTLLNRIPNYPYSVQWNDPFRFTVVTEDDERQDLSEQTDAQSQADNQTDYVTVYRFNWQPGMAFNLEVIDTPGFGDTPGVKQDEETVKKLEFSFTEKTVGHIDQLDAIALAVPAPDVRLSLRRNYILDSILSMFAKDAIQNLVIMTTFADRGESQVMRAIRAKTIAFHKIFKFNNTALFAATRGEDSAFARVFWEMGMKTHEVYFKLLCCLPPPPQSLSLTRAVLRERASARRNSDYAAINRRGNR